jgi:hypothetical protein
LISSEENKNRADREDRLAFLRLARAGFVRVGLMENGPAADAPGGERYTLMNMFRTSLADPKFVLSGWPELNENRDLRREVLACLNHAGAWRMSDEVPAKVAARIEALRDFDRNLRASPQGIRIVRQAEKPLGVRVTSMLQIVDANGDAVRQAAKRVTERARRDNTSLNSRSNWYRLIELESKYSDAVQYSALMALRDIVDINYNAMVNESLNDEGMSLSAEYAEAADTAAHEFTPGQFPGKRWADLSHAEGTGNWLRWAEMPQLLAELEVLSPDARLRELETRHAEWITSYEARRSWGVSIRTALPAAAGTVVTSFATSVMTGAMPGQAAGAAALTGAATLVAGTPTIRAWKERNSARLENRSISNDERHAIRTGAAGWLERIRRRQ